MKFLSKPQKPHCWAIFGSSRPDEPFFKNWALSIFSFSDSLTSQKKSEKSVEPTLRSWIPGTFCINPSSTKKNITHISQNRKVPLPYS